MHLFTVVCVLICLKSTHAGYSFPDGFLFGTGTSAIQIEGAWNEDGKGENVWDCMLHSQPNCTIDFQNADIAADSYHKYGEDIKALVQLGVDFYRFSISWTRILPKPEANFVNKAGLVYYNKLIDELISNNIQPVVTMYHWDLPLYLQDLGGWANSHVADYFEAYAKILFDNFGDRVKWWITFSGPQEIIKTSRIGIRHVPSVSTQSIGEYLSAYNILYAHARVYHLYDSDYRDHQNGKVGIALTSSWFEPLSQSDPDVTAAENIMQLNLGIFAHPIFSDKGGYPPVAKERVCNSAKNRPPTQLRPICESSIQGTADFFGLNHYTTFLTSVPSGNTNQDVCDSPFSTTQDEKWAKSASSWLKVVPWGFRNLLNWIHTTYNGPAIFVTENGFSDKGELTDDCRIEYYKSYLAEMLNAINEDGCNVIGYTAWSLIDGFEWDRGYTEKFGLFHVNFEDSSRPRTPKASVKVLSDIIRNRSVDYDPQRNKCLPKSTVVGVKTPSLKGALPRPVPEVTPSATAPGMALETTLEATLEMAPKTTAEPAPKATEETATETSEEAAARVTEEAAAEAAARVTEEAAAEAAARVTEEAAAEAAARVTEEAAAEAAARVTEEAAAEAAARVTEEAAAEAAARVTEEAAAETVTETTPEIPQKTDKPRKKPKICKLFFRR